MNICVVPGYKCTFVAFKDLVEGNQEAFSKWVAEYELVKVNAHKSILLMNVTDMDACRAFMTTPEMREWDEENGCVDIVYSMERVN